LQPAKVVERLLGRSKVSRKDTKEELKEVLAGLKNPFEVARQYKLKPELIARWKDIVLEGLETLFQGEG
jgi:hypothetical protein